MQMRTLLAVFLLSAITVPAHAAPVRYVLDPVHTRVLFAVSHAGFSSALGTVSGSTGEIWFDPDDWSGARLKATVPIARIDLGDPKWNQAALARNLLDAQTHPQASFVSTRVEPVDATHAAIFGLLTLHGVSREVKLAVTLNAVKRHPMPPFRRTAGFSATVTLSRKAFGIDAWPSMIGDQVELRIEAEATRARGTGEPDDSAATAPASRASEPVLPEAAPADAQPADEVPVRAVPADPTP